MRCPHCHEIHPDNTNFCPKIGLVIDRDELEEEGPPPPQAPDRRVTIGAAALGAILMVAGVLMLLRGGFSMPAASQEEDAGLSEVATSTPTAVTGGGSGSVSPNPLPSQSPLPAAENLLPTPQPSPTTPPAQTDLDTWIAYAYGKENDSEIYLLRPSTGESRQITTNRYNDDAPSLLARTNELVFASYRDDGWELYLLDLDTGKETQLTHFDGQARFPAWSPEPGVRKIVFEGRQDTSSGKRYSIWMLDVDSGSLTDLTKGSADSRPQWSPDGKQVVFGRALNDSDRNGKITTADFLTISIVDLASHKITHPVNEIDKDNYQYAWSPDGEWILFCSVRGDVNGDGYANLDDSRNLWLVRPDGSGQHELRMGNQSIFSPGWSPSGEYIIYMVHRGENREEMWLYDTKQQSSSQLLNAGPIYHPEFAVGIP